MENQSSSSSLPQFLSSFTQSKLYKSSFIPIASGTFAGVSQVVVGHPLDTLKVKLAVSAGKTNESALQCLGRVYKNEGLVGLYRGASSPLVAAGLFNATVFFSWNTFKGLIAEDPKNLKFHELVLISVPTGLINSSVLAPTERLKTILQVQSDNPKAKQFKGPIDLLKHLLQNAKGNSVFERYSNALRNIGKGFGATAHRECVGMVLYFGVFEFVKKRLIENYGMSTGTASFFAGGCSGVVFWSLCYPFDMAKSVIQADINGEKYNKTANTLMQLYKENGIKGWFRGCSVCVIRAAPTNAAIFATYTLFENLFKDIAAKEKTRLKQ